MYTLRIKNLEVSTVLGVYDTERGKRPVVLAITLSAATDKAAVSDHIADAVDYSRVETAVIERLESRSFKLIERLVQDAAEIILALDSRIQSVTVEADKPGALRRAESVSVSVTLARS